jgi:hypothetical protein
MLIEIDQKGRNGLYTSPSRKGCNQELNILLAIRILEYSLSKADLIVA